MHNVRTDLALEAAVMSPQGVPAGVQIQEDASAHGVKVTRVLVENDEGMRAVGKPQGTYITVEAQGLTGSDADVAQQTARTFGKELAIMVGDKVSKQRPALIVGLGNRSVTPDSLGPRVAQHVFVTRHIFNLLPDQVDERASSVCCIAPGVLGDTGMESGEVIAALVREINPSFVVAVDALASASARRIATTVQLADTGISPGAGIGNNRPRLDADSLGVPVYAVGVPLVVHAATLVSEAARAGLQNKKPEPEITDLEEVLSTHCGDMIVTPKDIDQIAEDCAQTVADGINIALHPGMTLDEVNAYIN